MMFESNPVRSDFGLLPRFASRATSFSASLAVNFVAAVSFVVVAMSGVHEHVEVPRYDTVELLFPVSQPPAPKPVVVHVEPVKTPVILRTESTPLHTEKSGIEPHLGLENASLPAASMPTLPASKPSHSNELKSFASAVPAAAAVPNRDSSATVGVFGNPAGAQPNAASTASSAPVVGNFDQAVFGGNTPGRSSSGSVRNVAFAASADGTGRAKQAGGSPKPAQFGSGVGTGSEAGVPHGSVSGTSFSTALPVATSVQLAGSGQNSSFVSPIVTFEPRPRYTAQAYEQKVEGEVTFQVRLCASGRIQVLRKVNGLGYGLDEEAENVIRGIQFQPAVKDGQPADQVTLIHVYFRLAQG